MRGKFAKKSQFWKLIFAFGYLLGSSRSFASILDEDLSCRVEKVCPGGQIVSCEGLGFQSKCDIFPDGVSCQYYEAGQLYVEAKKCPSNVDPTFSLFDARAASDAEVIVRRPDGMYDVKCNDGSRERVDRDTLNSGNICVGGSSNGRYQIRCDGFGNSYHPARSSDGMKFGTFISSEDCKMIAESSINNVTCASIMPGSFHITRISDGVRLGARANLSECLDASLLNRQGVTCVPYSSGWRLIDVKTGDTLGTTNTAAACLFTLRAARDGVACVDHGGGKYIVTRLSDEKFFGRAATLDDCTKATDNAFMGRVCAHIGGNRWQIFDVQSGNPEQGHWSLNACVTQL